MAKAPSLYYHRPSGLQDVELLFCGDGGFSMAPHFHDRWVLWLTTGGAERFHYHGAESVLQPQSFSLIPPGEVHANRPYESDRTLLSFYIPDTVMRCFFQEYGGRDAVLLRGALLTDLRTTQQLACLHAQLLRCPDTLRNQSAFHLAMARILRLAGGPQPRSTPASRDNGRIRQAMELLRTRLNEDLGLADLAAACACSERHILRLFKTNLGMTPCACLQELRLEQARLRIAAGAALAATALACGFTDQSHLNRRFKARYGVTPGAYRRQMLGPDE